MPGTTGHLLPRTIFFAVSKCFFCKSAKSAYICSPNLGAVAQMVEQRTENPCVGSSILPSTTVTRSIERVFLLTGIIDTFGWKFTVCGGPLFGPPHTVFRGFRMWGYKDWTPTHACRPGRDPSITPAGGDASRCLASRGYLATGCDRGRIAPRLPLFVDAG